jgi:hypothetical protein
MTDDVGIAAAAAIVGGLITGFYGHARAYINRPKLQLNFDQDSPAYKVTLNYKLRDIDVEDVIIRVQLTNAGRTTAKHCRVFLTSVKEVVSNQEIATQYFDSKPLAWPGWDFTPRDIPPKVPFYVEVVGVYKHELGWNFKLESIETRGMKNFKGTYRLELTATADNAEPVSRKIDVTYAGDWHQLRASKVA